MQNIRIVLAFISLTGASCHFIARTGHGAKAPRTETGYSIKDWLHKHLFDGGTIATVRPEVFFDYQVMEGSPMVFESLTGKFLSIGYGDGKFCPKNVDKTFTDLVPYAFLNPKPYNYLANEMMQISGDGSKKTIRDTSYPHLPTICEDLRSLDGTAFTLNTTGTDYVLILPFALYLGNRVQVMDLKKYYRSAMANKKARIQIIFLNLDKQEWWGKEWNEKIHFKV
jgi:hypothetical protein